jgi:hypothetical protein
MTPPLTDIQETVILSVYYGGKVFFGRDRLWNYLKTNKPEAKISRRQTLEWLKKQDNYQKNYIAPKEKSSRTVLTTHTVNK